MRRHLITAFLFVAATAASADSLISLDDHGALLTPGAPRISPDGRYVAYTLDERIHVVSTDGGTPRAVTVPTSSATSPHWAQDSASLYFLSDRGGTQQLWQLPVAGFGEAARRTTFERGVDSLLLSPDETDLLLRLGDPADESTTDAEPAPWVIDRRQFKEDAGDGYLTAPPDEHYYRLALDSGELEPVTSGDFTEYDAAWSPDGMQVVFVSQRDGDPDCCYRSDLYRIATAADGDMRQLVRLTDDERVDSAPAFSPDGKWLAWLSASDGVYGISELMLMPATGGEPRRLAAELDRTVVDFRFTPDSRSILFSYESHGGTHLARVTLRNARVEVLLDGDRNVTGFDVDRAGRIVARMNGANDAANLYALRGGRWQALTAINDDFLASRQLGDKRKVSFTVDDGTVVESFITTPPGYRPGDSHPAILLIHGGPVGQFTWGYDFAAQYFAARGYVVLEPNPRGSTGRGQDFVRAIYRSWGITDYPDVMGAVDYAIDAGLADPERLFVTGYSYGGYMTNIVITRTGRFKAAASGAGHAHLIANYGHDIYQRWYNWEFGPPTREPALYNALSPLLDADKVTTPTIFLGGREDWNVPILSSELFYQTLKTLGVDTRLVVYPDSHHGGWDARFEQDYLQRVADWFDRFDPDR